MSASTSSLIDKIAELDKRIQEARATGAPIEELVSSRQVLVKELTEANATLQEKGLLKG